MRKFIVFDLGETLIDFNLEGIWHDILKKEVIPRMYTALMAQSAEFNERRVNPDQFLKVVYRNIALKDEEEKKKSMIYRIKRYFEFFGIPQMASYIQSQIAAFASTLHLRVRLYPEVPRVLEHLKSKGYTLGLWSDTPWQCPGSIIEQYMLKFKIRQYFDMTLFSGDRDNKKPDPKVFQMVLNVSGKEKNDMVYVGNSANDIIVSKRFGVPVVWVNRFEGEKRLDESCPIPDYTISSLDGLKDILPIEK